MNHWEKLNSYIYEILSFPKDQISFSRSRILDDQKKILQTDCMGIIHLLLEKLNIPFTPKEYKAYEVYNTIVEQGAINKIYHLEEGMILGWRKLQPPTTGDTGHFCILMGKPFEEAPNEYSIDIFEVTKSSDGPRLHKLFLRTDPLGVLIGVKWSDTKWKMTQLIAFSPFHTKRVKCLRCDRSIKTCLCEELPLKKWKAPSIQVIRFPEEKKHPLNSVKILESSFSDLNVFDTEIIDPEQFHRPILIYPGPEAMEFDSLEDLDHDFILLDGTWKKTKRILFQNPWLMDIPHIKLKRSIPPLYKIRKELSLEHYSTLEIYSELWKSLEPQNFYKTLRLEQIFQKMINQQIENMGADTYRNNYQHYPGF